MGRKWWPALWRVFSSPPLSTRLLNRVSGLQGHAAQPGCLQASPRAGEHAWSPQPEWPDGALQGDRGAVEVAEGEEREEEEEEKVVAPVEATEVVYMFSLLVASLVPLSMRGDGDPPQRVEGWPG